VPATDILSRARSAATIFAMNVDEEMGIYRGEVLTIMEALADLRADVTAIRTYLLEEDDEEEGEEGADGEV
jgi:hypothetical protein